MLLRGPLCITTCASGSMATRIGFRSARCTFSSAAPQHSRLPGRRSSRTHCGSHVAAPCTRFGMSKAGPGHARLLAFLLAISALALVSCATRVPQVLTSQIVPETFIAKSAGATPVWPSEDWWQGFGSPELSQLIRAAQESNHDLAAASARVMEARALTLIARSSLFPKLDVQLQAQRAGSRASSTASGSSTPSSTLSSGLSTPSSGRSTADVFGADAVASYGLDVWGLARANLRAARESVKAKRFAQQALALSITANVANGYFSVLALRERIAIANEDITAINGILEI